MNYKDVATSILAAIGGKGNVVSVMTCLTRLRLTLADPSVVDVNSIRGIRGVLGTTTRGDSGIEVVFGPTSIEGISREFAIQSGIELNDNCNACANPLPLDSHPDYEIKDEAGSAKSSRVERVVITPGRRMSYRAQQQAAIDDKRLEEEDLDALRAFLDNSSTKVSDSSAPKKSGGRSLLVINGPNINMLGIREPNIYGKADYSALVRTCKAAAAEAGFRDIKCYQSNHEGAIVDEIQAALGTYDGIVMNPAAYTHTSIAILDALKAVSIPCVEVHISHVENREDFRQVSYVRQACFETVTGMGIEGYRKAILDLAAYLGM